MQTFIHFSEEPYMSHTTKLIHQFVEDTAYLSINIMELISIAIILITTVVAFYKLVKHKPFARVYLLHGQSIGLTFKLGAEILRTIPARTLDDIWQIFLLIVVKIMMGLLIEWELKAVEDPSSSDGFHHHGGQPSIFHFRLKGHDLDAAQPAPAEEPAETEPAADSKPASAADTNQPHLLKVK